MIRIIGFFCVVACIFYILFLSGCGQTVPEMNRREVSIDGHWYIESYRGVPSPGGLYSLTHSGSCPTCARVDSIRFVTLLNAMSK